MNDHLKAAFSSQVEKEPYARKMGMQLVEMGPGHAVVEMKPGDEDMNLFGMVHGGVIFSLIDEAFQISCNAHGTLAVALNVQVTYHHPPQKNQRLEAESREIHRSKKTATYEIRVTDEDGRLIASCSALAYRKGVTLPFLEGGEPRCLSGKT